MSKTVSLVLGSGGARGYAHIGVIKNIVKLGYEIKSISGASMGALVGGLYACGKLDEFEEWVSEIDFFEYIKFLDFSFSKMGLIEGNKILEKIESMIGDILIEDLDIDYRAVATDIHSQREVFFKSGKLIDAIRASIAIPTIFTPKEINGRLFVDGGILDPVPVAAVISSLSDFIIAVDVNSDENILEKHKYILNNEEKKSEKFINFFKSNEDKLNYYIISMKSIEIMQRAITRYKLASYSPDILINISSDVCEIFDFHKAKNIIKYGEVVSKEILDKDLK
jgi:NTE family protein